MHMRIEEYKTRSVMIGRKPRQEGDQFKTAHIALFPENNPHKTGITPTKALDFPNMEKVRIRNLSVSYYLEGNDLVINDLSKVKLEIDGEKRKIILRAEQEQVEQREQS